MADLASRLVGLNDRFPQTWVPLGISGQKMADVLGNHIPAKQLSKVRIIRAHCNRETDAVEFADDIDRVDFSIPVLLVDSAVHSGRSMLSVSKKLTEVGARDIITYSLVTKCNSEIVPNYFGVLIGDHDRAYFQLKSIPNNRLQSKYPFGILRSITDDDKDRSFLNTGVDSMDKTTFSDLLYEVRTRKTNVFVYEHAGKICGFVSFEKKGLSVFLDGIASDVEYRGKNIGGLLIRWLETWARSHNCETIDLMAIEPRVSFYEKMGYHVYGEPLSLSGEEYKGMRRKLLYNIRPEIA